MKIGGFEINFPVPFARQKAANLSSVNEGRGWYRIFESFAGAWQRNITIDREAVLSNFAVYACMTLIASDIAKCRMKLVEQQASGIWTELSSPAFSPVLRKPNKNQTRIQFWENWILSKLMRGNTYVLKERDQRGIVVALYVLDPQRVTPMVTDIGDVYYQLAADNLAGLTEDVLVPASEIIHDRFNCLFHPLVGTSPIFANALAATQGLNIQTNSTKLFANNSQPGGILTAPGNIDGDAAKRLKEQWETNFSGENSGRVAVLSDGLTYTKISLTAVEGQLIEQLKWTAEVVCATFHVPPYKINIGEMPKFDNIQALNVEYYSQCLQVLMEAGELCMDEGLGLDEAKDGRLLGTSFETENLLRMDTAAQANVAVKLTGGGIYKINEGRAKFDLEPVKGGDTPYLQEQNFSLAALAKRDSQDDPFAKGGATPAAAAAPAANQNTPSKEMVSLARRARLSQIVGLKEIPNPVKAIPDYSSSRALIVYDKQRP